MALPSKQSPGTKGCTLLERQRTTAANLIVVVSGQQDLALVVSEMRWRAAQIAQTVEVTPKTKCDLPWRVSDLESGHVKFSHQREIINRMAVRF